MPFQKETKDFITDKNYTSRSGDPMLGDKGKAGKRMAGWKTFDELPEPSGKKGRLKKGSGNKQYASN